MKFSLGGVAAVLCVVQVVVVDAQSGAGPAMLLPGSRALDVKHLTPQTQSMRVLVRAGSGDTTEREWSLVTRSDRVIDAPAGQMAQTFAYAAPRAMRDSETPNRDALPSLYSYSHEGERTRAHAPHAP